MLKDTVARLKIFSEKNNIVHKSFEIGMLIKGINGMLEIIGGILFMFLNPIRLNSLVIALTQNELSEDPKDIIANFMVKFSSNFTVSAEHFWAFYLLSHGIIKLILVMLLWKRKIWAYPITIISLVLFIMYQIYRYTIYHSISVIILTVFDIIMIILTFKEYKRIKKLYA